MSFTFQLYPETVHPSTAGHYQLDALCEYFTLPIAQIMYSSPSGYHGLCFNGTIQGVGVGVGEKSWAVLGGCGFSYYEPFAARDLGIDKVSAESTVHTDYVHSPPPPPRELWHLELQSISCPSELYVGPAELESSCGNSTYRWCRTGLGDNYYDGHDSVEVLKLHRYVRT